MASCRGLPLNLVWQVTVMGGELGPRAGPYLLAYPSPPPPWMGHRIPGCWKQEEGQRPMANCSLRGLAPFKETYHHLHLSPRVIITQRGLSWGEHKEIPPLPSSRQHNGPFTLRGPQPHTWLSISPSHPLNSCPGDLQMTQDPLFSCHKSTSFS